MAQNGTVFRAEIDNGVLTGTTSAALPNVKVKVVNPTEFFGTKSYVKVLSPASTFSADGTLANHANSAATGSGCLPRTAIKERYVAPRATSAARRVTERGSAASTCSGSQTSDTSEVKNGRLIAHNVQELLADLRHGRVIENCG